MAANREGTLGITLITGESLGLPNDSYYSACGAAYGNVYFDCQCHAKKENPLLLITAAKAHEVE